jgi:hypothetical protein
MSIEDVVLVATVREDICNHGSRAEIPLLIEATQARIAHAVVDDTPPAISKHIAFEKEEPVSTEVVTAAPGAEGDSDSGSKTAATTSSEEDDKREGDEQVVSPSAVWLVNAVQVIDMVLVNEGRSRCKLNRREQTGSRTRDSEGQIGKHPRRPCGRSTPEGRRRDLGERAEGDRKFR